MWPPPTRRRFVVGSLGLAMVGVGGVVVHGGSMTAAPPVTGPAPTPSSVGPRGVLGAVHAQRVEPAASPTTPPAPVAHEPAVVDHGLDPRWQPATRAAKKILALRERVEDSITVSAYQHRTVIDTEAGIYLWDCSGMAAWFLRRAAPKARKAMDKGRPVARDYYRKIAKASTRRAREGWRRLPHIEDVRPGDLFAWIRPPDFPSRNTGHMGFAAEPARAVPNIPGAYTLRIFDATSLPHQDDTRDREGEGGIGEGTILFLTDETGRGTAYGWFGLRSRGVIETDIVFGRVNR